MWCEPLRLAFLSLLFSASTFTASLAAVAVMTCQAVTVPRQEGTFCSAPPAPTFASPGLLSLFQVCALIRAEFCVSADASLTT